MGGVGGGKGGGGVLGPERTIFVVKNTLLETPCVQLFWLGV